MSQRKPWVGGNWKCNGTLELIDELTSVFNKVEYDPKTVDLVICPAAIHLERVKQKLKKPFKVCAQNISQTGNGAYTGEISVSMLLDMGVEWTLIGHSERRQYYGETDDIVAKKVEISQQLGLNAAVCIGETLEERDANKTDEVCRRQVEAFVSKVKDWNKIVIAYEPVWAIGTGKTATPQQAQDAHQKIRELIKDKVGEDVSRQLRIVYGGSVNDTNCKSLILEDIDGFLVGGASLKSSFVTIIDAAVQ